MTGFDDLRIQSAAMQYSDDPDQRAHDLNLVLSRRSHVTALTEIDTPEFRDLVRKFALKHGHNVRFPRDAQTGRITHEPICVRNDLRITSFRFDEFIHPARDPGPHGARGITTTRAEFKGNAISINWAHWLTDWNLPERYRKNMHLTEMMVRRVQAEGSRKKLAFWGGDINWDIDDPTTNQPGKTLRAGGLFTAYDELGRPDLPTHGKRTIDLIGSYAPDTRVVPIKADVHFDSEQHAFVDHRQITVTFRIKRLAA